MANSHSPFRFSQFPLTICGLGYSGKVLAGSTSAAHRVIKGAAFMLHGYVLRTPNGITHAVINTVLKIKRIKALATIGERFLKY
nr:hypothetical protein [Candidatus Sigynarchaeum springense]